MIEIALEESPVNDHQASGLAENAVKNAQGQFNALKDALESREGRRIGGEQPIAPWLVMHAASVMNRGRNDHEGFTAYRRWKGGELKQAIGGVWGMRTSRASAMSRVEQV